jgi:hypothetical protein
MFVKAREKCNERNAGSEWNFGEIYFSDLMHGGSAQIHRRQSRETDDW